MAELVELADATYRRQCVNEEWREAVKLATKKHSLRTVASFAGVSHARVAQIVKGSSE